MIPIKEGALCWAIAATDERSMMIKHAIVSRFIIFNFNLFNSNNGCNDDHHDDRRGRGHDHGRGYAFRIVSVCDDRDTLRNSLITASTRRPAGLSFVLIAFSRVVAFFKCYIGLTAVKANGLDVNAPTGHKSTVTPLKSK